MFIFCFDQSKTSTKDNVLSYHLGCVISVAKFRRIFIKTKFSRKINEIIENSQVLYFDCEHFYCIQIMKVTDGNDPSRREEEGNNSNGRINGRISPNGQMINGHHVLTNSDSDNEAADENNAEHSGYELLPQNDPSRPPNATAPDPEIDKNEDEEDDDQPEETLEDILQRVQQHQQTQEPSSHLQSMIEQSQRQVEVEIVQERNSIFTSQPSSSSSQSSESRSATIDMSQDRVESIRSAMSSIQLPASAIPPWASNLSDEEIQNVLRDKFSDVMSIQKNPK